MYNDIGQQGPNVYHFCLSSAAGLSKTTILVSQQNVLGPATDFPHEIWKISVASWAIVSVQNVS
jgi:hypothetical protein